MGSPMPSGLLSQYTPAQLAAAQANVMLMSNGVPSVPPDALNVNSAGQVYSSGLLNQTPQQKAAVAASMQSIKQNGLFNAPVPPLQSALSQPQTPQTTDPDAGLTLPDGTPVSAAKSLIQAHEPGAQGYNAAFGQSGLPAGYTTGPHGFPQWDGNNVGSRYGGKYSGNKSHAAGMYQFEPDTWNPIAAKLGITDFSPASQEKVATALLQTNGMSPWAPFNPRLAAAYSNYKSTGQMSNINLAALGGNTIGPQVASAGGSDTTDPAQLPGQLRGLGLSGMMGGVTGTPQTAQMLQNMLQSPAVSSLMSGGGNTSRTLAAMAAGFLGGRGGAQSLSGGFKGLAEGMQADETDRLGLLKELLANNNTLQNSQLTYLRGLPKQAQDNMAALTRNGQNSPSQAAQQAYGPLGLPVPFSSPQLAQMDADFYKNKPLASGTETQQQNLLAAATSSNQLANQALMYKAAIDKGETNGGFNLDRLSRLRYGVDNSGVPLTTPSGASSQYNQFDAFNTQAASLLANASKGVVTDGRLDNAKQAIEGAGLNTPQAGSSHMSTIAAAAEIQRRTAFTRLNKLLTDQQKPALSSNQFNQMIGGAANPYSGLSDEDLTKALSPTTQGGEQAGTQGVPPVPGQPQATPAATPTTLRTPNGMGVQYIPPPPQ